MQSALEVQQQVLLPCEEDALGTCYGGGAERSPAAAAAPPPPSPTNALMFFKVCRGSSTVDENAHTAVEKKSLPSFPNPFQNYGKTTRPPRHVETSSISNGAAAAGGAATVSPAAAGAISGLDTTTTTTTTSRKLDNCSGRTSSRKGFVKRTALGTGTANSFSKPESIPSLQQAFTSFKQAYPRFEETTAVDQLRESQYGHLEEDGHVCLDYNGFGLFSQWQQVCLSLHKFLFKFSDSDASLDNVVLVRCMPGCCCFTQMHVWTMLFCSLNAAATSWGFLWICGSVLCFSLCGFAIRSCICERKSI